MSSTTVGELTGIERLPQWLVSLLHGDLGGDYISGRASDTFSFTLASSEPALRAKPPRRKYDSAVVGRADDDRFTAKGLFRVQGIAQWVVDHYHLSLPPLSTRPAKLPDRTGAASYVGELETIPPDALPSPKESAATLKRLSALAEKPNGDAEGERVPSWDYILIRCREKVGLASEVRGVLIARCCRRCARFAV